MFPNFGALVPLPHHFDTRSGYFQKHFPNISLFQHAVSTTYKKVKTEKQTKYELPKTEPSSLRTESVRSGSGASFLYEWVVMLRTSSFSSTSSFRVTGDNSRLLSIRFKTLIVVPLPPLLRVMATRYLSSLRNRP